MDSQAQAAAERACATGHTLAAKAEGAEEAAEEAGSDSEVEAVAVAGLGFSP